MPTHPLEPRVWQVAAKLEALMVVHGGSGPGGVYEPLELGMLVPRLLVSPRLLCSTLAPTSSAVAMQAGRKPTT